MLQKTKLTLLRLFAIVAFVVMFVVASIGLASCSSDEKNVVSIIKNSDGELVVTYSDGSEQNLGSVDGEDGDDGVSITDITYDSTTGELTVEYSNGTYSEPIDISSLIDSGECDHNYVELPYDFNGDGDGVLSLVDCGNDGLVLKYCTVCGNVEVIVDPATGAHTLDYSDTSTWVITGDTVTAVATCSVCGQHIATTGTVVSKVTTPAECNAEGEITYTATIVHGDQTYTSTTTEAIKATGLHTYTYTDSEEPVTIQMTDGTPAYVYLNGSTAHATYEELAAIFGEDNLYRADCTSGATLITNSAFVCDHCGEQFHAYVDGEAHTKAETATIENYVAATCQAPGSYDDVYYCTVCGAELERTKVDIAQLAHVYATDADNDANWTWASDYSTATLTFTCTLCGTETITENATISSVHTDKTCQNAETNVYTAEVVYDGVYYYGTATEIVNDERVIGYHTTSSGFTYVIRTIDGVEGFVYAYDVATGTVSEKPLTASELLAIGGMMLSYGGEDNYSYGIITCMTCDYVATGVETDPAVVIKNNITLEKGTHNYTAASEGAWTWADDYSSAKLEVTCVEAGCGHVGYLEAEVTSAPNASGTGTIYTAVATYGTVTFTTSVEFLTAAADTEQAVTLSSTATSASYEVEATATGPYAIEFSGTESYIVVTSLYGTYTSYSAAAAVSALSAKPLEETSAINYLLDSDGNIAIVPQGAVIYVEVFLYDTTTTSSVSASFTVTKQAIPTLTAGESYSVTMGADLYSLTTSIVIEDAGYYTVSLTAPENAVIVVESDDGNYYYSSWWVTSTLYIIDGYNYSEDVPVSIPADTKLNVYITFSSDDLTAITVLISKGDYTPETSGGDEDTYDYTLTTAGLTEEIVGDGSYLGKAYTVYVSEAGDYTFTVSGDDADIGIEINNEVDWSGEVTAPLEAGDVVTIYACKTGTVTIAVEIKTTTIAHGEEGVATADAGTYYVWYMGDYAWWSDWALVENTKSVATLAEDGTITWVVADNNINNATWYANQLFYENAELTEGTSYDLSITVVATAAGSITINGEVVTLAADEVRTLTITYTESSKASLSIQLGVDGVGADLDACTITFSNISWSEYVPEVVAGTDYTVTLDETNSSVLTTITIEEAGYYTVAVSDAAYIIVYDEEYNYYYNSRNMSSGYIEDGNNGGVVYIPADTVLSVYIILIDTSASTEVTALIAVDSDYVPAVGGDIYAELGETISATEADTNAYVAVTEAGDYILKLALTSSEITLSDYVDTYSDFTMQAGYYNLNYSDLTISDDGTYAYIKFTLDDADITYINEYYDGYIELTLNLYKYTGTLFYTVVISAVEVDQGITLTPTIVAVYATGNVSVDVHCEDLVLSSEDYIITISCESYEGAFVIECFPYGAEVNNDYRLNVNLSSTNFASTDEVPSFVITWTDADGNVVATATYTVSTSGDSGETSYTTYTIEYAATTKDESGLAAFTATYTSEATEETSSIIVDYSKLENLKAGNEKSTEAESGEDVVTYSYAYEFKASRPVVITVPEGTTDVSVTIYVSHTTKNETRKVYIGTDTTTTENTATIAVSGTETSAPEYLYTLTADLDAGETYYIWADNTVHIYAFVITYTLAD